MPALAALLAAALLAPPAAAEDGEDFGPVVALRVGWAWPLGDLRPGEPLDGVALGELPVRLDVGYRFGGRLRATAFIELASVEVASSRCIAGASCSATSLRAGLEGQVHLAPRGALDPWLGIGLGVEVLRADALPPGGSAPEDQSWAGFVLPTVGLGLDVAVSRSVAFGPWAEIGVGQFTRDPSGAIDRRATHAWVQAGLRVALDM